MSSNPPVQSLSLNQDNFFTDRFSNAIRALAMDAVQQANSGHPGMPMGMADIAQALWLRHLRHNPSNPSWFNRDRFILSNGHGSMLLYALLHLTGYDLSINDLRAFRQLDSKTPGHPEVGITPGVETTTGPLGQGLANAVGMALAEALLAKEFNQADCKIVDHHTYAFVGDGCLMEGISHEVCSLAGTLKLSKLIVLYDDNGISIDGKVENWFTDNTSKRFEAYGWVVDFVNGHDINAVDTAIRKAKSRVSEFTAGPTLIICKTVIGYGAPHVAGTDKVHGSPLGEAEITATRAALNWPYAAFEIPEDIYKAWDCRNAGQQAEADWQKTFDFYTQHYPSLSAEFTRRMYQQLPADFDATVSQLLEQVSAQKENIATRKASQHAITALVKALPELLGGSADLTGSNFTDWPGAVALRAAQLSVDASNTLEQVHPQGRHINYGVREFGMSAMMNGIALHGGYMPFGGTFLTFSDYARNALRMAALMRQRVIYVYTHDSIGLGEDGPTHQAIEHAASLRLIPHLSVWRPCDTTETAVAWAEAVKYQGPTCLLLSRQNLPFVERTAIQVTDISRGGYILREAKQHDINIHPQAIIIATGSEVALALNAQQILSAKHIYVRVVSMPCTHLFDAQTEEYRKTILPLGIPRVAVEAGVSDYWRKYVGAIDSKQGAVVGIDCFGESAPAAVLFRHFGLTAEKVAEHVQYVLAD